jgi:hypothetical protein
MRAEELLADISLAPPVLSAELAALEEVEFDLSLLGFADCSRLVCSTSGSTSPIT